MKVPPRTARKARLLVFVSVVLVACGDRTRHTTTAEVPAISDDQTSRPDVGLRSHEDELYVASRWVWPNRKISVCWENPSSGNAVERGWVKEAVARTWEAVSRVDFVGWGTCAAKSRGIRIRIADERPRSYFGKYLDGRKNGMILNFTFTKWGESCQRNVRYCIDGYAVHEFGHALAFAHEQNRSDTPPWCNERQGSNGDKTVGTWDVESVMNYCNEQLNNGGNLSATDIAGVQRYYGRR